MNCTGKIHAKLDQLPPPTIGQQMLCGDCIRTLERHLAETTAKLVLLHALHDGRQTPRRSDRPGTSTPVPINVAAYDLAQEIPAVLASWTALVCEERSLRGPDTHDRCPAWLQGQLDYLVAQPWVDDLAGEVDDLMHRAEALIRIRPHRHRLEPPCPSCGAVRLGRWDGTDQVDCEACGRAWPHEKYPWMVRLALDESRSCMTATEAAARLEVTVGTVRNYVAEGLVRKLGTIDGTARYAAWDVEQLVAAKDAAADLEEAS